MREPGPDGLDRLDSLANDWWQAIRNTSYVPLSSASSRVLLASLLRQLADALGADAVGADAPDSHDASSSDARTADARTADAPSPNRSPGEAPRPQVPAALADTARQIGAALVDAGFTNPVVVARSAPIMRRLDVDGRAGPDDGWLPAILGGFAHGYAAALQNRTLREQETIRRSVLDARNQAVAAMQISEARFRAVFDNAAVAIAVGDVDGRLLHVNAALAGMLGGRIDDLVGSSLFEIFHPDDTEAIDRYINGADPDATIRLVARFHDARGGYGWAQLSVTSIPDARDGSRFYLMVGEDITEQRRLQAQLHHQARHDPLTRLPNRLLLAEHLYQMVTTAEPGEMIGLCFIDLDGFKEVNDKHGHGFGDRVLAAVANRLNSCAEMVARLGGDEFVAVLRDRPGQTAAQEVAQAIMASLAAPIMVGDLALTVSASIGVVVLPAAGAELDLLLDAADGALYQAKDAGRGRWVLHSSIREAGA